MQSIGIDMLEISRLKKLKDNDTFLNKNYTDNELNYLKIRNFNVQTLAGLFCAKEAFLKSIKKGINNYSLKDIEILHDDNNSPFIKLHNELEEKYKKANISLSITHDKDYAEAIVLISF